jgi:hypothetical protein
VRRATFVSSPERGTDKSHDRLVVTGRRPVIVGEIRKSQLEPNNVKTISGDDRRAFMAAKPAGFSQSELIGAMAA